VEDHVPSLRPEGHPDRVGQPVDAAKNPLPRGIAVHNFFRHDRSPAAPRSAVRVKPTGLRLEYRSAAIDDGQHFVFSHDEVLLAIEFDFLTRILAKQNLIARLDIERDTLAVVPYLAIAGGDHLTPLRLFFRRVGMMMAPLFCSPSSRRRTTIRS